MLISKYKYTYVYIYEVYTHFHKLSYIIYNVTFGFINQYLTLKLPPAHSVTLFKSVLIVSYVYIEDILPNLTSINFSLTLSFTIVSYCISYVEVLITKILLLFLVKLYFSHMYFHILIVPNKHVIFLSVKVYAIPKLYD